MPEYLKAFSMHHEQKKQKATLSSGTSSRRKVMIICETQGSPGDSSWGSLRLAKVGHTGGLGGRMPRTRLYRAGGEISEMLPSALGALDLLGHSKGVFQQYREEEPAAARKAFGTSSRFRLLLPYSLLAMDHAA